MRGVRFLKEDNRRLRHLTSEEIEKLIENCTEYLKPIVITAIHTGMRKGEILKLKWKNIDFEQQLISVTETKSGRPREIPMNNFLTETLKSVKFMGEYVFCRSDGTRFQNIRKSFETAVEKANLKDCTFHTLRHTFASLLVMGGVDLTTVKELMGHKSIEMTLRYAHLAPDHKRFAVEVLP